MIALLAALLALASPPPAAHDGADLYAQHCITCHGANLIGTPNGPPLIHVGAANVDFQLATGRMPVAAPGTEPMRGPPRFSREQIDALIAYITTHGGAGGPALPSVHASRDLPRGRVVWEENCEQCHGVTGYGAVAGYGWIAPPITPATPLQIAEATRVGPGIMPKFSDRLLPQHDLDALVAYADTFRHPDDRGGFSMISAGPVGEGLVGWLVGVGGAIIVMLLVGETLKRRTSPS
jgi:ubiquinol-cytochrome c reductase cytochrome c subunit